MQKEIMSDYVFNFGKHKGDKLQDVVESDPGYVYWCACKIERFRNMLKKDYPELFQLLIKAQRALQSSEEAWAYTGGRMPQFDPIFRRMYRRAKKEHRSPEAPQARPCPR